MAVETTATRKAASLPGDLASDPIRMVFPPNNPGRRFIAGIAGIFNCRGLGFSEKARRCSRLYQDKVRNEFATGEEESLQSYAEHIYKFPSEQTIGPVPAEKPELAANPEQPSQASHFGERLAKTAATLAPPCLLQDYGSAIDREAAQECGRRRESPGSVATKNTKRHKS